MKFSELERAAAHGEHEQRRFELAKAALVGVTIALHEGIRPADLADLAIDTLAIADAVLAELDKQKEEPA